MLNAAATRGRTPDLTLLFDLGAETGGARRAAARGHTNRIDREPLEFHDRVRQGFLELARAEPRRFVTIDAGREIQDVELQVWAAFESRIIGPRQASAPPPPAR